MRMNAALGVSIVLVGLVATAQELPTTVCSWENVRDGAEFKSVSNRNSLQSVNDCANAIGDYMLHWEPLRGITMFDGVVWLKKTDGTVIGTCTTHTVRPITRPERISLPFFATVEDEEKAVSFRRKFSAIPAYLEKQSIDLLRSPGWQSLFGQYYQVACDTPVS